MTTTRALLLAFALSQTGCAAMIDAMFATGEACYKETQDHGRHARYENKSFGEHFADSFFDDDDDCRCRPHGDTTTVIVHHHH